MLEKNKEFYSISRLRLRISAMGNRIKNNTVTVSVVKLFSPNLSEWVVL
jgi:hypothetical protein